MTSQLLWSTLRACKTHLAAMPRVAYEPLWAASGKQTRLRWQPQRWRSSRVLQRRRSLLSRPCSVPYLLGCIFLEDWLLSVVCIHACPLIDSPPPALAL